MASLVDEEASDVPIKGLPGRILGTIFSPRETYASVAARPRILGALAAVLVVTAGATGVFLSTRVGRDSLLDQQLRTMESFGLRPSDEVYRSMQSNLRYAPYVAAASQVFVIPVVAAVVGGVVVTAFNAFMGGKATFKQVYAIVVHSGFVVALQALFVQPLNYARGSMSNPAKVGVFFPLLDTSSFLARFLGAIDLFLVWWMISLSIGVGVLYRRRTAPIAMTFVGCYVVIALAVALVMTSFPGA